MTIGEWLLLWGESRERAALEFYGCAMSATGNPAATTGCGGDALQNLVVIAIESDARALRRANPRVPLSAWIRGAMRNLKAQDAVARTRARLTSRTDIEDIGARSPEQDEVRAEHDDNEILETSDKSRLTTRQTEALDFFAKGQRISEVAHSLRISWRAAEERLRRALLNLKPRQPPGPDPVRRWASELLSMSGHLLRPEHRALLEAHVRGDSHEQVARSLHLTREAVRCRLRRLRAGAAAPTPPPPRAAPRHRRR